MRILRALIPGSLPYYSYGRVLAYTGKGPRILVSAGVCCDIALCANEPDRGWEEEIYGDCLGINSKAF